MIHIYKTGGIHNRDGKEYSIKAINLEDKAKFLLDGWVSSLDDVRRPKVKKPVKKVIKDDNQE